MAFPLADRLTALFTQLGIPLDEVKLPLTTVYDLVEGRINLNAVLKTAAEHKVLTELYAWLESGRVELADAQRTAWTALLL